ncbi:DUF397 domain-containing protein [Streptomyces argenteolus]|uniref:DUF397 domain-containing protein n=1 Tax=Streptomyces argenteolus TaxID=67274 RepID=A0ABW6XAW6_9ACTN
MSVERVPRYTDEPAWFKSSYSGSGGGDCVEVAAGPGAVFVRDTKTGCDGPVLRVGRSGWAAFVASAAG